MFDPTIYENLKVAFENQLYDLDNLDGIILITNRMDRLEMSVMSREFSLQFVLTDYPDVTAEISLEASLKDLAAEILEQPGETPACTLRLRFYMQLTNVDTQCRQIDDIIRNIWKSETTSTQTISYVYGRETPSYMNTIEVRFVRRISEDHMGDIPGVIDHVIQTLRDLRDLQLS
ncbi:hypothetical protein D3C76_802310 [compost metagenome]